MIPPSCVSELDYPRSMRSSFLLLSMLLSAPLFGAESLPADSASVSLCQSDAEISFRIAVVGRRGTAEYSSMLRGANEACDQEASLDVSLSEHPYDEDTGFDTVVDLLNAPLQRRPHVILGPTESTVFANLEDFAEVPQPTVPIVSPLVTIRSDNTSEGWYFQLNVNAIQRAQRMHQFLESLGVQNLAIIYEGNDFGESSEMAFREVLTAAQESTYQSFRMEAAGDNYIPWLRRLASETRPEALGILGSRAVISDIARSTRSLGSNGLFAYNPYIFSTIDLRPAYAEDMYFLSVSDAGSAAQDGAGEALDLAYDSTRLIFAIVNGMLEDDIQLGSEQFPATFRSRLANRMNTDGVLEGSRTRMEFSGFSNATEPQVLHFEGSRVAAVGADLRNRFYRVVGNYFDIRDRRFGSAMLINLSLIASIVLLVTLRDLTRTLSVRMKDLIRFEFLLLIGFNIATAVIVFIILAETDLIDATWVSTFSACIVAVGYVGILNSTIFTTPGGEAVFARRYYEDLVKSINNNIRKRQYERLDPVINYIAFANSQSYLENALVASYGFDRDEGWKEKMKKLLAQELKGKSSIQQRKIIAEKLLAEMRDKTMQERRIIPKDTSRDEVQNPLPRINKEVERSMVSQKPPLTEVEKLVRGHHVNDERLAEFERELGDAGTPQAKYSVCFRWLSILCGYNYFLLWCENDYKLARRAVPVQDAKVEANNRVGPRAVFEARVLAESGGRNLVGKMLDISVYGCRLQFDRGEFKTQEELSISTVSSKAPFALENVKAKVVHIVQTEGNKTVVGLIWDDLSAGDSEKVENFIATLAA